LGTQDQQQMSDPLASDRRFVKQMAEEGLAQVELGKLAQERGSSAAVKEFGKHMVDDHGKSIEEMKLAAAKANIDCPTEVSRKSKKAQEKLAKLSGAEFDRAYAKMTVADHKNDVKEFDRESRKGNAPEVKEFAAKSLATHQEHLKLAQQLEGGNP
jgi:putative membrane protein